MRSNKGITLTSLIVYMIVFSIVIGTVAMISKSVTSNTDEIENSANSATQYTKLTTYLTDDINSVNFKSVEAKDNYINIIFVDNASHQYVYNNNKIYYISEKDGIIDKEIVLCSKITDYRFEYADNKLKISITIEGITYNNYYSVK